MRMGSDQKQTFQQLIQDQQENISHGRQSPLDNGYFLSRKRNRVKIYSSHRKLPSDFFQDSQEVTEYDYSPVKEQSYRYNDLDNQGNNSNRKVRTEMSEDPNLSHQSKVRKQIDKIFNDFSQQSINEEQNKKISILQDNIQRNIALQLQLKRSKLHRNPIERSLNAFQDSQQDSRSSLQKLSHRARIMSEDRNSLNTEDQKLPNLQKIYINPYEEDSPLITMPRQIPNLYKNKYAELNSINSDSQQMRQQIYRKVLFGNPPEKNKQQLIRQNPGQILPSLKHSNSERQHQLQCIQNQVTSLQYSDLYENEAKEKKEKPTVEQDMRNYSFNANFFKNQSGVKE